MSRETVCDACGGYGYTEAVSMSWTEEQFQEFSCKECNLEDDLGEFLEEVYSGDYVISEEEL